MTAEIFTDAVAAARAGASTDAIARRLGASPELVTAIVHEAERLDLLANGCDACPGGTEAPAACAGCPLAGDNSPR